MTTPWPPTLQILPLVTFFLPSSLWTTESGKCSQRQTCTQARAHERSTRTVTDSMLPSKGRRAECRERDGEEQNADQTKPERGREQESAWQRRFLGREASHAGEIMVPPMMHSCLTQPACQVGRPPLAATVSALLDGAFSQRKDLISEGRSLSHRQRTQWGGGRCTELALPPLLWPTPHWYLRT